MNRRKLLKGAAAVAASAPLAGLEVLTTAGEAVAAEETYHVALCEQHMNMIMVFPVNKLWTQQNRVWTWTAPVFKDEWGKDAWNDVSDIKFRSTPEYGWVALVTASGGKVGIVDMDTAAKRDADEKDLLWSARPYGNPHSIERIPGNGSIVVASSTVHEHPELLDEEYRNKYGKNEGFLTVYAPKTAEDPRSLERVQRIPFLRVHGLWFDGEYLWAAGARSIVRYRVVGKNLDTRLELVPDLNPDYPSSCDLNIHGLDPDYSDPSCLLMTGGANFGVSSVMKDNGVSLVIRPDNDFKSYSRVASGESFWVKANGSSPNEGGGTWVSDVVNFEPVDGRIPYARGLDRSSYGYSADFYKARVSSVNFS
ncbi:hypothetical protein ACFCZV_24750 [Streptomyces hydrogenans]|uniref:hypothetical protein n=1 Tax=Streptomyces hydrogenans TaxID=1873719 RepID=UPI0035E3AACB